MKEKGLIKKMWRNILQGLAKHPFQKGKQAVYPACGNGGKLAVPARMRKTHSAFEEFKLNQRMFSMLPFNPYTYFVTLLWSFVIEIANASKSVLKSTCR